MSDKLQNITKDISTKIQDTVEDIQESETMFEARALMRWLRRRWRREYVTDTDHAEVIEHVRSEGRLTSRYSFMVMMSCAIATLGLLLSSPAVVIGAMLISPLMSPIMSLGISLCVVDVGQFKKALEGIVVGLVLAVLMSAAIVYFSPLTDATPEILARTQPNLFDLLVAIFSGLAGGYAVIKRKGEGIVGVAIATALMPPLAVVGFGIATGSAPIAKGAFMLFMTNLLAISLSVTAIAKLYGFGTNHSAKHTAWQAALIIVVFGALSLPLGVALKNIAYQTYVTKTAKSTIKEYFGDKKVRISVFNIRFSDDDGTMIDAVVLTPTYQSGAQENTKKLLTEKIDGKLAFSLDQVVVSKEVIAEVKPKQAADSVIAATIPPPRWTRAEEMTGALQQATFFPTEYIKVDVDNKIASIHPKPGKGVKLDTLHQLELSLAERYPSWSIKVVPPYAALPYVFFEVGSNTLAQTEQDKLADIIWALHNWQVGEVTVVGFASSVGEFRQFNNSSLAFRRANVVLQALEQAGIQAQPHAEYHSYKQRQDERHFGLNSFQRVEVRLAHPKTSLLELSSPTAELQEPQIIEVVKEVVKEVRAPTDLPNAQEPLKSDVIATSIHPQPVVPDAQ